VNLNSSAGDSINSLYKLIRVPSRAKIKRLYLVSNVPTSGAADFDIAWSDNPSDGTLFVASPPATFPVIQINTGTPADNKLFGSAVSLVSASGITLTELTFKNTFLPTHQNLPLWQVLATLIASPNQGIIDPRASNSPAFQTDPGGFFDIVAKVTTALPTGSGNPSTVGLICEYVE
jgi:hypothetical protein